MWLLINILHLGSLVSWRACLSVRCGQNYIFLYCGGATLRKITKLRVKVLFVEQKPRKLMGKFAMIWGGKLHVPGDFISWLKRSILISLPLRGIKMCGSLHSTKNNDRWKVIIIQNKNMHHISFSSLKLAQCHPVC